MERFFWIGGGAALGGILRYVIGTAIQQRAGVPFPIGTLVVNVSGCFLIGAILSLLDRPGANAAWTFLLVTGFLGGYTTFSSFGWDTYLLVRDGEVLRAMANAAGSVLLGCLAVWGGALTGRALQ